MAASNRNALQSMYGAERTYYRGGRGTNSNTGEKIRPDVCLALSGGGIRSAAFSVGILAGMERANMLGEVDVISATSGGGYALAWLYAQQLARPSVSRAELFFGSGLSKRTDPVGTTTYHEPSDDAVTQLISRAEFVAPDRALIEFAGLGLFKSTWDVASRTLTGRAPATLLHHHYKRRIAATFLGNDGGIEWADVHDLLRGRGEPYPFPIFNAIAVDTRHLDQQRRSCSLDQLFEISPIRVGSDAIGFADRVDLLDLADTAAISGAAVDEEYGPFAWFFRFFKGGLGYTYNHGEHGMDWRVNKEWVDDLYLADGGFVENLSVYPLVKRLCRRIVAVDATEDPTLRFDWYARLKQNLWHEMRVKLRVEEIDAHIKDGVLGHRAAEIGGADEQYQRPVFEGKIGNFPWGASGEPEGIEITYVKLSWNERWMTTDPRFKCVADDAASYPCFPQEPSTKTGYSEPQFRAYVNLGAAIVARWLAPEPIEQTACLWNSPGSSVVTQHTNVPRCHYAPDRPWCGTKAGEHERHRLPATKAPPLQQ